MAQTLVNDIAKLEMAAQFMLGSSDVVTPDNRREAEQIFLDFRESIFPFNIYQHILENTQVNYVMFEVARSIGTCILKQWHQLSEEDIINVCKYLIEFPALKPNLPFFVTSEIFRSFSMILKCGSVDNDLLNCDFLSNTIEKYIHNENEQMQSLGLEVIESIAHEFSSNWRSVSVPISWNFNFRAKKQFENILLKKFLKLSLSTLSQILTNSDLSLPIHVKICDKFLRVALIVFSWNFSPHFFPLRLRALIPLVNTNAFRPPISWNEFFQDGSIVTFFMKLHNHVRQNENLCLNSLNCLAQLAAVMGDVLSSVEIEDTIPQLSPTSSRGQNNQKTHDLYIQTFIINILETFKELHTYEIFSFTVILYKLFTFHPINVFKRFPIDLMMKLIEFLSDIILKLIEPAMDYALRKNDCTYCDALSNLFHSWRYLIRGSIQFSSEISSLILNHNEKILAEFFRTILAPPYGKRLPLNDELFDESENEDEDDRVLFSNILLDLSMFSMYSLDPCMKFINSALNGRIQQFQNVSNNLSINEIKEWQEDMHWIFIFISFQFQNKGFSDNLNIPQQLVEYCLAKYRSREFIPINFDQLVHQSLTCPMNNEFSTENLDPYTLLIWYIFSWSVLEHNAFVSLEVDSPLISPELTRSFLWLLFNFFNAICLKDFNGINQELDVVEDTMLLPHIPITPSNTLQKFIEFNLNKVFTILTKFSGEKKLCIDAIQLIIFFVDNRAQALTQCDNFFDLISSIKLESLPSRRPLLKSLVMIGNVVVSNDIKTKIYKTILEPLSVKFYNYCSLTTKDESILADLTDLFECFSGIAEFCNGDSFESSELFNFLIPVLQNSSVLLLKYSESQMLVCAILEFFKTVSDNLFFYVESSEQCAEFHKHLIELINAYSITQLQKYQSIYISAVNEELENKIKDLITLIEVLCFSVSKTYMPTFDGAGSVENSAKVALLGFELIMPLMTEDMLKIPTLCNVFFRLICFICDLAPNVMMEISKQMFNSFLQCLDLALDNQFGPERIKSALEIIHNLTSHFCTKKESIDFIQLFNKYTPKVFKCALEYGYDSEIFDEASNALYSSICLDNENFSNYICELLQKPHNQCNAEKLKEAFIKLNSFNEYNEINRFGKRDFRSKLEKFSSDVYGILYL